MTWSKTRRFPLLIFERSIYNITETTCIADFLRARNDDRIFGRVLIGEQCRVYGIKFLVPGNMIDVLDVRGI